MAAPKQTYIGYLILLLLSIAAMLVSIIMEGMYPIIGNNMSRDLSRTIIYRILHFYIFFYCGLYLLLFRPYGLDSYIYLIFNLVLNIQWCVLGCCVLSYYELLNYDQEYRAFSTKFHPYIFSILRNWSDIAMDIVGIVIILTIVVILYSNNEIPIITKALYIGIFGYSIYVCCTGKNPLIDMIKNQDEFGENKVLAMKKEIERVDNLNMYPSNPDSFFMKYIA